MASCIALIDADTIKYSRAASIEKRVDVDCITIEPVHHAYHNVNNKIKQILERCRTKDFECHLTKLGDKTNFRYAIYEKYKANRIAQRKPFYLQDVHDYILQKYKGVEAVGQEADDTISIRHHELNSLGFDKKIVNSVICSIDKDLDNNPGWHYNYNKDVFYYVSEIQAKCNFYLQILCGDTADNIPRIKKGWRSKKTQQLMQSATSENELLDIVREVFKESYPILDFDVDYEILRRGRLLHLRTYENEMWRLP